MLIPDNIHPEQTIYFNGAFVLQAIQKNQVIEFFDLYETVLKELPTKHKMSMPVFVLCLDWLFLLNLVNFNAQGGVELCS